MIQILKYFQFSFVNSKSTGIAITTFTNGVYRTFDNREFVSSLFFDLSNAFDTTELALKKGIRNTQLSLFKSYLSNRMQYVIYDKPLSCKQCILMTLYALTSGPSIHQLITMANHELVKIQIWLLSNRLTLNTEKVTSRHFQQRQSNSKWPTTNKKWTICNSTGKHLLNFWVSILMKNLMEGLY